MAGKKMSPKRESKKDVEEAAMKAGRYGLMALFWLLVIGAATSFVFFVVYSAEAHGADRDLLSIDPYEHDFGRMTISAYATMIALLGAILMLMFYVTYMAHRHMKH